MSIRSWVSASRATKGIHEAPKLMLCVYMLTLSSERSGYGSVPQSLQRPSWRRRSCIHGSVLRGSGTGEITECEAWGDVLGRASDGWDGCVSSETRVGDGWDGFLRF